jgi:hypothetical protein
VLLIRLDAGMCEMKCFTPDGLDVLLIPLDVGICKMNHINLFASHCHITNCLAFNSLHYCTWISFCNSLREIQKRKLQQLIHVC